MTDVLLETRGLTKAFGAVRASDNVSLSLCAGEIHAIIGPNGAGKSTLIGQICGTLVPDSGSVHLAGVEVTARPPQARARLGLARTFQVSQLAMDDTVLQNAVLGALGASGSPWHFFRPALSDKTMRDTAEAALARVGLAEQASAVTAELSHGQRRLLEVAVALTLRPKVFVMDEPMAGLGTEGSASLTRLLDELRREAPILLVEHDMDAVFALADRISVLVYGQIIATGTVEEIRNNAAVREAYLGEAS
ncbi:ABC transporter ATP-binding protein [Tropicibacter sp. S64]|uniref:ABC transporter ATP-binding protein n=1 Tax=Tropicibacter sp. S64 TaxID=3415122 RepID=UPI003C7EA96E